MSRRKRETVAFAAQTSALKDANRKKITSVRYIWIAAVALLLCVFGLAGAFSEKFKRSVASGSTASTKAPLEPLPAQTNTPPLSKEYIYAGGKMLAIVDPNTNANSISGKAIYGSTPPEQAAKFVPGVLISAAGASVASIITDSTGSYILGNLISDGAYTVTPSKTGDINGINAFDGTLVLRCSAAGAGCTLTPDQKIAADTDKDGSVTSFDCTLILRYVAANQQTSDTGHVGYWRFPPPEAKNYPSFQGTLSNQNFESILIGEVSGDWAAPSGSTAPSLDESENSTKGKGKAFNQKAEQQSLAAQQQQQELEISLPQNAALTQGSTILIPVTIKNNSGRPVSSFNFDVKFSPALLQPVAATIERTGTLTDKCEAEAYRDAEGRIAVAGACLNSITSTTGTLLNLRFTVVGQANGASQEARTLKFQQTPLFEDSNGNQIVVGRTNGNVR